MQFKNKLNILITVLFLVFIQGCTQDNTVIDSVGTENKIIFIGPQLPLEGMLGDSFSYSFCKPDLEESGTTCGSLEPATNPIGGNPPYSFVLGYGAGLLPPGIRLNLNGLLEGNPLLEGSYTFEVCAKDAIQNQDCEIVNTNISKAVLLTAEITGQGSGYLHIESDPPIVDCSDETRACYSYNQGAEVTMTPVPNEGSFFETWTGDCTGTGNCTLIMDSSKDTEAIFSINEPEIIMDNSTEIIEDETEIPPVEPELTLAVEPTVTITSASLTNCRIDTSDWDMRYWTLAAEGTASMDAMATGSLSLTPKTIDIDDGEAEYHGTYEFNLDCGVWTLNAEPGYYADCRREEGNPTNTTWRLTYESTGTNVPKTIIALAKIHPYPKDQPKQYAEAEQVAGNC
ncbi:MAG: hypothetical protein Q7S92_03485 [Candidatus Diapherotrites archaeon]|nr:hypothetical protein [Candidatus Diapherotrites archaeon]